MTQLLVPSADVSNAGSWTTAPLWSKVDDPNDTVPADYITKANNSTGACRLGPLVSTSGAIVDPLVSTGHILKIYCARTGARTTTIVVSLYQGTTLITSGLSASPTGATYSLFTYTLTAAQADAITNYADLRLDINCTLSGTSNAPRVSCCWLEIPGVSAVALTVANAAQAQTADNAVLTAHVPSFTLTVQDAGQGQAVDSLTLTPHQPSVPLSVADTSQLQNVGNIALTQHGSLSVADAAQTQSADSVDLTQHNLLGVANAAQAQTADNAVLTVHVPTFTLVVQSAAQAQSAESLTVTPRYSISVAGAVQTQNADSVALTQHANLAIASCAQVQTADAPTLTPHSGTSIPLTVQDAVQNQSVSSLDLIQHHVLTVAGAAHIQTVGNIVLTPSQMAFELEVDDSILRQGADRINLIAHIPGSSLSIQDALQTQVVSGVDVEGHVPHGPGPVARLAGSYAEWDLHRTSNWW